MNKRRYCVEYEMEQLLGIWLFGLKIRCSTLELAPRIKRNNNFPVHCNHSHNPEISTRFGRSIDDKTPAFDMHLENEMNVLVRIS